MPGSFGLRSGAIGSSRSRVALPTTQATPIPGQSNCSPCTGNASRAMIAEARRREHPADRRRDAAHVPRRGGGGPSAQRNPNRKSRQSAHSAIQTGRSAHHAADSGSGCGATGGEHEHRGQHDRGHVPEVERHDRRVPGRDREQTRARRSHRFAAPSSSSTSPVCAKPSASNAMDGGKALDRSALLSVIIDTG